jgi:hypothetical protein
LNTLTEQNVINAGGTLLLTVMYAGLLLLVQRAERKRRLITFLVMISVGGIMYGYGEYRMTRECNLTHFTMLCDAWWIDASTAVMSANSNIRAVIYAVLFNVVFWLFIGRYNPPGSSEENIKVLGLND